MTQYALHARQQNSKTKKSISLPWRSVMQRINGGYLLLTLLITGVAAYVFQINNLAVKGYYISDLQEQLAALQEQNTDLDAVVLELQSLDAVRAKVTHLDMVPVGKSTYLSGSSAVAANR